MFFHCDEYDDNISDVIRVQFCSYGILFLFRRVGHQPDGKRLRDGIPKLEQRITNSEGSVPQERDHMSCNRTVNRDFYLYQVPENVLNFSNEIWTSVHEGTNSLRYATENDITMLVIRFLECFVRAMKLNLWFGTEIAVKSIKPDICVIADGDRLVGVVEVKKPTKKLPILEEPTVLGELCDQLLMLQGFYCTGHSHDIGRVAVCMV